MLEEASQPSDERLPHERQGIEDTLGFWSVGVNKNTGEVTAKNNLPLERDAGDVVPRSQSERLLAEKAYRAGDMEAYRKHTKAAEDHERIDNRQSGP